MVHLGTEMPFNLHLSRLEAIHKPLGVLMSILLQPTEVIANGIPDFGLSANESGGYTLRVFGAVDISMDFDLDLRQKRTHQHPPKYINGRKTGALPDRYRSSAR